MLINVANRYLEIPLVDERTARMVAYKMWANGTAEPDQETIDRHTKVIDVQKVSADKAGEFLPKTWIAFFEVYDRGSYDGNNIEMQVIMIGRITGPGREFDSPIGKIVVPDYEPLDEDSDEYKQAAKIMGVKEVTINTDNPTVYGLDNEITIAGMGAPMNNLISGPQQTGYYGTKWGDVTRISQKVGSAWEACRDCFGMVAGNMYTKFLGTRQADIRKSIQSKLNNPDGWELIPMDQLDKLGKLRRCQRCGGLLDENTGGCLSQTCPFNDHYQRCKVGWIGHPDHPDVDDNTPCVCAKEPQE